VHRDEKYQKSENEDTEGEENKRTSRKCLKNDHSVESSPKFREYLRSKKRNTSQFNTITNSSRDFGKLKTLAIPLS
jgi:hypothetical protein